MCMSVLKSGIGMWWPVATTVGEDCSFLDSFYGAYTIQKKNMEIVKSDKNLQKKIAQKSPKM